MNIEQLHYFLQVVESGSVNAAAQKFYMTPQAINASIRKLEEEYESPLLIRSKKGVTLTPQGHVFASYAKEVIEKTKKFIYCCKHTTHRTAIYPAHYRYFPRPFLRKPFYPLRCTTLHRFSRRPM